MSLWTDIRDAVEGVAQGLAAPYFAAADIVQGKNVLHSVEYRGLQAIGAQGGGSALFVAADSKAAQGLGSALNPYTFGVSGSVIEGAGYAGEAVKGHELTDAELFAAYRGIGEASTAAIAGAALVPTGPSATQVGVTAGISKFAKTGQASDLIGAAGGALGADPNLISSAQDYYAPPAQPEIGARNFSPRIQLKTPQASVSVDQAASGSILPIVAVGLGALLLFTMRRR